MALTALQKLVAGASNIFNPQPAANASIYVLARADAQRQSMSSLGAGLIGAAVPQTPLMRAQALQNAFSGMGNMGTNVYNAAQMRLAEKQYNDEQSSRTRMSELLESSLGGAMPQTAPAPASAVPGMAMPPIAPMMDGGFSRAANVSPVQAIIANPPPPTVATPGGMATPTAGTTGAARPLTQAQIQKVRGLKSLGKTEEAVKQLFDFQYENAQPYKPQGEFAQNIQDMQNMNLPQDQIDQYKNQFFYGKLEGLAAIDADPRIPADTKKLMRDAEVRKLKSQGFDYLGVMEMQQPDGTWAYVQPSKTGDKPVVLGTSPGPTEEYMAPITQKQPDGTYAYVQPSKSGKPPIVIGPAPAPGEEEVAKKKAELDSKILEFKPRATAAIIRAETKAANVIDTGRKALEIIRNNPKGVTGITGKLAQANPKADAYQLKKYFETIQSNVGFNELSAMKQESPTGSGVGQVAVQELTSLQATQGNLEIGQSAEALESALINIINSTDSLIESARSGYIDDYGADLIGAEKLYDLTGIYDITDSEADFLRSNADDPAALRAFDRQFGMGASKFVLGAQ
jgi:hypothetical protein